MPAPARRKFRRRGRKNSLEPRGSRVAQAGILTGRETTPFAMWLAGLWPAGPRLALFGPRFVSGSWRLGGALLPAKSMWPVRRHSATTQRGALSPSPSPHRPRIPSIDNIQVHMYRRSRLQQWSDARGSQLCGVSLCRELCEGPRTHRRG